MKNSQPSHVGVLGFIIKPIIIIYLFQTLFVGHCLYKYQIRITYLCPMRIQFNRIAFVAPLIQYYYYSFIFMHHLA